ncbi:hypothetical protein [Paraburkholderia aspalathi]|uniref:hypothetical protein n=1 Tax=Paraburkholderia aspalathi TaxID=1324617 RepID=UPI0038BCB8C6
MNFDDIYSQFANFSFGAPGQPEVAEHSEGAAPTVEHPLRSTLPTRRSSTALGSRRSSLSGVQTVRGRVKIITQRVKAEAGRPINLSEAEQQIVDGGFLRAKHVRAVSIALDVMNAGCSFCEAGKWTLKKIGEGAEAKGHDNLEKTLKPSSIQAAYSPATAERILRDAESADILGYVATLNSDQSAHLHMGQKVVGFELSDDPGKEALGEALEYGPNGRRQYPIDFKELDGSLQTLKGVEDWKKLPVTGDYDLHDLFSFTGRPHTVPSNGIEESSLIDALNAAISAADSDLRPRNEPYMNLVKHGPQVNYVAFTMAEESNTHLSRNVAEPRFPVAMYVAKNGWAVVKNTDELANLYKKYKVALKESWARRGSVSFEGPADNVALTRRSSVNTTSSGNTSRRPSLAHVLTKQ